VDPPPQFPFGAIPQMRVIHTNLRDTKYENTHKVTSLSAQIHVTHTHTYAHIGRYRELYTQQQTRGGEGFPVDLPLQFPFGAIPPNACESYTFGKP